MKLTKHEYRILRWAVVQAEAWRGSLVGNPDTTELDKFDAKVAEAFAILAANSPYKRRRGRK